MKYDDIFAPFHTPIQPPTRLEIIGDKIWDTMIVLTIGAGFMSLTYVIVTNMINYLPNTLK